MEKSSVKFDYDLNGEIEKISKEYEEAKRKKILSYTDNGKSHNTKKIYFVSFIMCIVLLIIIFLTVLVKDITDIM
jgi:heme/copper-type cytochrome/quinol oxidase subunit 4